PRYVLGIEPVSRTVIIGTRELAGIGEVRTGVPTWTATPPALPLAAQVQLRAHAAPVPCLVHAEDDGLRIVLAEEQRGVAPGQSAVLYEQDAERGDRVLGQATVSTARERHEPVRH
ncbi:MAG: aminomethyltransferase beta-barrel domain-containing protein, partial [Blastococcus sp.]